MKLKSNLKDLKLIYDTKKLLDDMDIISDAIANKEVYTAINLAGQVQDKHDKTIKKLYELGVIPTNDLRAYYKQTALNL